MAIATTATMQAPRAQAIPLRERILLVVLYVTVLASSVAFIEPSPHDALMGVLALACLIAGVRFERVFALPFLLLVVWNVAGLISLTNVANDEKAIQYAATSVYLAIAAAMFACLFAQNTLQRLAAMRAAYVLTAVFAALGGIAGYFQMFPGAYDLLTYQGRATGLFKDPNVFGPFLIWPALIVLERMLSRRISLTGLAVVAIILFGLLLSFSRGAWFHFAVSCITMVALAFVTAPSPPRCGCVFCVECGRRRVAACCLRGAALVRLDLRHVPGARAPAQFLRCRRRRTFPAAATGRRCHAVISERHGTVCLRQSARPAAAQRLSASLPGLWLGRRRRLYLLVLTTIWVGLRSALVRTPWHGYQIVALAAFVGEMLEGFIIDTDHWRHFFLLLGMIWGLFAASLRYKKNAVANHLPARG